MNAIENKKPAKAKVVKEPKIKKPTKKDVAAEANALKLFNNMCFLIKSVTPEFIQTNIVRLSRTQFSDAGKKIIADEAKKVAELASKNDKIVLPKEWAILMEYDKN